MKRQLPSTASVDEPQRNVRRRNSFTHVNFQPRVPSMAINRHADNQSFTSVSGVNISSSSDTPQGLQALAGSTSSCVRQRNARIRNPFAQSMAPHFRVFTQQETQSVVSLEQPHGLQSGVQSLAENRHADHQSPTSVPGESISDSSDETDNLPPFWTIVPPVAPRWNYTRVILSSVAPPTGSQSLDQFTTSQLSEHPQNRSSRVQTNNHSQYQSPPIIQDARHHDMPMDIDGMGYEELLALEERIGKVNIGVKTSELSKFVKKIICCGDQDEAELCVICLEQYVDADIMGELKCGHEYHFSCIGKWIEEQVVCPICRQRAANFEQ